MPGWHIHLGSCWRPKRLSSPLTRYLRSRTVTLLEANHLERYLSSGPFPRSSVGMPFARNLNQFVVWRLIGGVGIGAASVISPNYIAEIAPTRVRGRCVTLYQLGIVVGILAAVFVNMLIQRMGDESWNISTGWRWMFLAGVAPAILFAL